MLTARVVDHRVRIQEMLNAKIGDACAVAAEVLAVAYRRALQKTEAPPHSKPGEIPHAYLGWKPGGFRVLNDSDSSEINNPGQVAFLSEYIDSSPTKKGDSAVVGFLQAPHIGGRDGNYLLIFDQTNRPWTGPVFDDTRAEMKKEFIASLKVPF